MKKTIVILLILLAIVAIYPFKVNAMGQIIDDGDGFLQQGNGDKIDQAQLTSISNTVFNIFFTIGVAVAVIMTAVLGIKFMTASIEGKAKVKEQLTVLLVGCIVVFGAFTIWKIAINIGNSLVPEAGGNSEYEELEPDIVTGLPGTQPDSAEKWKPTSTAKLLEEAENLVEQANNIAIMATKEYKLKALDNLQEALKYVNNGANNNNLSSETKNKYKDMQTKLNNAIENLNEKIK